MTRPITLKTDVAREIIHRAFDAGYRVTVDDGDGFEQPAADPAAAFAILDSVMEAEVRIYSGKHPRSAEKPEWMMVISPPGVDTDETAANFTSGGWIDEQWELIYRQLQTVRRAAGAHLTFRP